MQTIGKGCRTFKTFADVATVLAFHETVLTKHHAHYLASTGICQNEEIKLKFEATLL